jgi:hypothetical protein
MYYGMRRLRLCIKDPASSPASPSIGLWKSRHTQWGIPRRLDYHKHLDCHQSNRYMSLRCGVASSRSHKELSYFSKTEALYKMEVPIYVPVFVTHRRLSPSQMHRQSRYPPARHLPRFSSARSIPRSLDWRFLILWWIRCLGWLPPSSVESDLDRHRDCAGSWRL